MTPDLVHWYYGQCCFALLFYVDFGGIQGPSSFVMKGPDVGREA